MEREALRAAVSSPARPGAAGDRPALLPRADPGQDGQDHGGQPGPDLPGGEEGHGVSPPQAGGVAAFSPRAGSLRPPSSSPIWSPVRKSRSPSMSETARQASRICSTRAHSASGCSFRNRARRTLRLCRHGPVLRLAGECPAAQRPGRILHQFAQGGHKITSQFIAYSNMISQEKLLLNAIVYGYSFQLYNTNEVRILQDYRKIIREKREKKGLSQSALAKLVGVSQPAINQIEVRRAHAQPCTPHENL